jgi:3-oxoacyl-[acyl-carrier protein] reductase
MINTAKCMERNDRYTGIFPFTSAGAGDILPESNSFDSGRKHDMKLKDKTAVITGAARGLGRAIAQDMAAHGARVALVDVLGSELEQAAETIERQGGISLVCRTDVSLEEQVNQMAADVLNAFSGIDILVNNAGVIGPARITGTKSLHDWTDTININLNGAFYCTRAVLPAMKKQKAWPGGSIVNIVSGLGNMPFPRFCAYAAAKAGLIQMTRSLSEELAPWDIRVNAIDPGIMDTAMQETIRSYGRERLGDELHERFHSFRRQGQLKSPDQVAPLAVFLASSDSGRVNGRIGTLKEYEDLNIGFRAG